MNDATTVGELLLALARRRPDVTAVLHRTSQHVSTSTWRTVVARGVSMASALRDLGVRPGGRVGVVAAQRPEYITVLFGIWLADAVAVPIHHTCTGLEVAGIVAGSSLQVLVLSGPKQLRKLATEVHRIEVPVILMNDAEILETMDERGRSFLRLQDLTEEHLPADLELLDALVGDDEDTDTFPVPTARPEDPAVIIHTPGTSGEYKGVVLSHRALVYQGREIARVLGLAEADLQLLVLPLSHVLGMVSVLGCMVVGAGVAIGGGFRSLVEDLGIFRPTFVVGVPRMYEKLVLKIRAGTEELSVAWRMVFHLGMDASRERLERRLQEEPVDWLADLKHGLADRLVFPRVRGLFGGRLRFFVSGAAPLSREVAMFISSLGVPVYEGYGLTECGGASHLNAPGRFRPGSVGRALDGVETRIESDGEILLRSPACMDGYLGDPDGTAAMLGEDGWIHTGDIGRLDGDGYLTVSGRKKELLVTAVGKNVSPHKIETALKRIPFINRAAVFGDGRPHLVALVTLNEERCRQWAAQEGREGITSGALAGDLDLYERVEREIEAMNREMAPPERVRRFAILGRQFTVEDGELTSHDKIRRHQIQERYSSVLDSLFDEEG
ncbi:MAG: long-chain fatty acid--CoA ligase [Pseudomonadota bacterium]